MTQCIDSTDINELFITGTWAWALLLLYQLDPTLFPP